MLQKYLPALCAIICYPLAYLWADGAFVFLALAWAALIYSAEGSQAWYFKFGLGFLVFGLASFAAADSFAVIQLIAWLAYILARPLWGKQRAFLALLFLFLSAEAIPFYTPLEQSLSLGLSQVYTSNLEFWAAWYYEAGQFTASFQLMLSGLFGYFILAQMENRAKPARILLLLSLLILLLPLVFCLSADGYNVKAAVNQLSWGMSPMDRFVARLSFFLAFFLLLFAAVRKLLPEKNADDRFT